MENKQDFTQGSIFNKLLHFMIPILGALILQAMYGAGFIFIVFYNLLSCIFRGLGNSNLPLLFVAIACVVNIVGDLVFVAVLHMNVVGAALATVFGIILCMIYYKKMQKEFV